MYEKCCLLHNSEKKILTNFGNHIFIKHIEYMEYILVNNFYLYYYYFQ